MKIKDKILIAECTAYDFKEMLEKKKIKSWLKSISAFSNTEGGSLYYGVDDEGMIVGLKDPQSDADFISETIKSRIDPIPEFEILPFEYEEKQLLEVRVKSGCFTPYYYYQDGARTAYIRVGNESVECNSQQLLSLVLNGTHKTWDSLSTKTFASKHSFVILANTFREQTHQEWNEKYLESFGLVTSEGMLTNAGQLFVDNCTLFQSRIFCTRWLGLHKDDAIDSVEHRANLVLLLRYGMDFISNHTMHGWVKMPNYRLNLPDYSERAIFEGLVNHLIHRDYTFIGAEVHIDIYDDRIEFVSPGVMLDGTPIQDRNVYDVPSMRRNPVIADVFTQLDYMERRGSGLRKMKELTECLPNYQAEMSPCYRTIGGSFYTTFYNLNWSLNGRIEVNQIVERFKGTEENVGVTEENVGVNGENVGVNGENVGVTEENVGVNGVSIGRTAQKILDIVIADPSITLDKIADRISITRRSVERQVMKLRRRGILTHEGSDKTGYWCVMPQNIKNLFK